MTPTGIFNPYAKPEKPKPQMQSVYDDGVSTESGIVPESSITLDGGSFGMVITGVSTTKDAADTLIKLMNDIHKTFSVELVDNGIRVGSGVYEGEVILKTDSGSMTVYVGTDATAETKEPLAFRRIAATLKKLPVSSLLERYKVRLYERG